MGPLAAESTATAGCSWEAAGGLAGGAAGAAAGAAVVAGTGIGELPPPTLDAPFRGAPVPAPAALVEIDAPLGAAAVPVAAGALVAAAAGLPLSARSTV
jgi:hypothetical protein